MSSGEIFTSESLFPRVFYQTRDADPFKNI